MTGFTSPNETKLKAMTNQPASMLSPAALRLDSIRGSTGFFTGTFRISGLRAVPRTYGQPFHRAELVDVSGTLTCYGWPGEITILGQPKELDAVTVTGSARVFNGKVIADLRRVELVASGFATDLALQLLPASRCPVPLFIPRLVAAIGKITDPDLLRLVYAVLSIKEVATELLRVPGSVSHHHSFPGGLLVHTVEVIETVLAWPGIDIQTRNLAAAAGLFHDIGKVLTIRLPGQSTELGGLVSHENLAIYICGPALKVLETAWPAGAYALMHIWTAQIGEYAYDRKALAAHLVSAADGVSAYAAAHAKAFEPHAAWRRSSSLDEQRFWRPLDTRQSQSPEKG